VDKCIYENLQNRTKLQDSDFLCRGRGKPVTSYPGGAVIAENFWGGVATVAFLSKN